MSILKLLYGDTKLLKTKINLNYIFKKILVCTKQQIVFLSYKNQKVNFVQVKSLFWEPYKTHSGQNVEFFKVKPGGT